MKDARLFFEKSKTNSKGEATVYIIVHLQSKTRKFSTGIRCKPEKWNERQKRIKGNSKDTNDKNLIIANSLSRMNEILVRFRLQDVDLTIDLLANEWKNPSRRIDFHSFYDEALEERKTDLAYGTYKHHKSFGKKLREFKPEMTFSEINYDLINRFKRWLKSKKGNDISTINTNLKRWRAYLNIAKRKGVITRNPFDDYTIRDIKIERSFLTSDELLELWKAYKNEVFSESLTNVIRHFLFMCLTGVRISDFKRLEITNINNFSLYYLPHKTVNHKREIVKVPLSNQALRLIEDEPIQGNKLFNPISEQKMNKYIKLVMKELEIHKKITIHSARHTFATLWLEKTKDLAGLQQLLGHSDIKETMIYAHVSEGMLKDGMKDFESGLFQ